MGESLVRETSVLHHLRVTEVSQGLMASHCGRLFADMGADVRRVDASEGSSLRSEPPLAAAAGNTAGDEPESLLATYLADGKHTLSIDSASDDFHERLDEILRESDVLIEDSWPGSLFAGEFAPEALRVRHPALIVISLSPFGRTGPFRNWKGGELCAESFGGLAYVTGLPDRPPLKLAGNVYEFATAVQGFNGGMAALRTRRLDGAGRVVDVSAAESVASMQEWLGLYNSLGLVQGRSETAVPFYYPHVPFPCADGYFNVGMAYSNTQAAMATFVGDVGLGEDPRFATVMSCFLNHHEMAERIRAGIKDRKRDELFDLATSLGMVCGPLSTPDEVAEIPQLEARDFWRFVALPDGRSMKVPGSPLRLRTHPRVREREDVGGAREEPRPSSPREGGRRPLEGLRVIDFTVAWAGPMLTRVLAEMGAEVIRVGSTSHPWRGLEMATWPENDPGDDPWNRQPYYIDKFAGKREVALDVTKPRGRELLEELLSISDIFVENHSPRALSKMGLRYEQLAEKFPQLIMASVSGFGQEGPWGPRQSTGDVIEGLAGLSSCTGYPGGEPERAGNTVIDAMAGVVGAAAVLAAIEYRAEHGHGAYLDQSMLEAAVASFPEPVLASSAGAVIPVRAGNAHASRTPHGIYPCRGDDQWIAIDVDSERAWSSLARALARENWMTDSRFETADLRAAHRDELDAELSEATSSSDKNELEVRLQQAGVAAAALLDLRELVMNPHLRERGMIQKVCDPATGWRTWLRIFPGQIEGFDLSIPRPAPMLGEHNEEVLGELLGISAQELEALERDQIIGQRPIDPTPEMDRLDPELYSEYPGIREYDPDYRQRLGLDADHRDD